MENNLENTQPISTDNVKVEETTTQLNLNEVGIPYSLVAPERLPEESFESYKERRRAVTSLLRRYLKQGNYMNSKQLIPGQDQYAANVEHVRYQRRHS
jgi:hypothetical protein